MSNAAKVAFGSDETCMLAFIASIQPPNIMPQSSEKRP